MIAVAASVATQTTLTMKEASTQTADLKGIVTRHFYLPNSVILIDTRINVVLACINVHLAT